MSNTLLESLWARIDANIGSRITQIVELLTQSKAANQEAAGYKDAAAASAAQAATMRDEVGSYVEELDPDRLQTLIDNKISYIVDGAPGDLDTLREIAEYAQDNRGITDQLNAAIGNKADKSHSHAQSEITGLTTALDGKAAKSHTHTQAQVTGLSAALNGKSDTGHKHEISDVTGLQTELDSKPTHNTMNSGLNGKANKTHTHTTSQVTGLDAALDGKADKSYVDARPAIFTVPDINSASTDNLVPGDVVVDTTTWIFYYLK